MPGKATAPEGVTEQAAAVRATLDRLRTEIHRVIVGHAAVVEDVLIAFVAGGHVLLEGVPGLGKTLLVRTLADCIAVEFNRVQFTPDLMPADVTGTNIVMESETGARSFVFQKGPIFANIVLADEINRATPKTQSALLEAMAEAAVTVAGTRYVLPPPFFVLATQNPIEMEGTYPLPEAQLDRFLFKLEVGSPTVAELVAIFDRTTVPEMAAPSSVTAGADVLEMRALSRQVPIATPLLQYVARLVRATHPETDDAVAETKRFVRYGASPRAGQAMVLAAKVRALWQGRYHVALEDLAAVAHQALRHRIILNFEGEAEGIRPDAVVDAVLKGTPALPPG